MKLTQPHSRCAFGPSLDGYRDHPSSLSVVSSIPGHHNIWIGDSLEAKASFAVEEGVTTRQAVATGEAAAPARQRPATFKRVRQLPSQAHAAATGCPTSVWLPRGPQHSPMRLRNLPGLQELGSRLRLGRAQLQPVALPGS